MKTRKKAIAFILAAVLVFISRSAVEAKQIQGSRVDLEETEQETTREEYISRAELVRISEDIGERYGICPELLQAMAETESSLNTRAENGSCKGLMQISEKWHVERMERLGVTDIYDAYGNMLIAADYLAELFSKNSDVYYVLMRYSMRTDTAERNYKAGNYSAYAIKITERSAELERLHGK